MWRVLAIVAGLLAAQVPAKAAERLFNFTGEEYGRLLDLMASDVPFTKHEHKCDPPGTPDKWHCEERLDDLLIAVFAKDAASQVGSILIFTTPAQFERAAKVAAVAGLSLDRRQVASRDLRAAARRVGAVVAKVTRAFESTWVSGFFDSIHDGGASYFFMFDKKGRQVLLRLTPDE